MFFCFLQHSLICHKFCLLRHYCLSNSALFSCYHMVGEKEKSGKCQVIWNCKIRSYLIFGWCCEKNIYTWKSINLYCLFRFKIKQSPLYVAYKSNQVECLMILLVAGWKDGPVRLVINIRDSYVKLSQLAQKQRICLNILMFGTGR